MSATTSPHDHQAAPPPTPGFREPGQDRPWTDHGVPRLPRTYVRRVRLWAELDRAAAGCVTLVVAPSGAGKTLGVGGWVRERWRPQEHLVEWINADTRWDAERLAATLRAGDTTDPDGSASRPRLVVIDDAHHLAASALRLIDHLLHEPPDSIRLVLLSRWDLPLTRLVPELLGHFSVLRGGVVAMDGTEARELLTEHARTTRVEILDPIIEHAQGWCAALALTGRAIAASSDPVLAARRYSTGHAGRADRVVSEVFAALQARERHLLLCVSQEQTVSAATAVHLTRDPGAEQTLNGLETTGLLVTCVDTAASGRDSDRGYRIHPLLAEVARRRLVVGGVDVERARATVSRAVHLDLARGDRDRAFDRLVAVHECDQAAAVLASDGAYLVMSGQAESISGFARRHPDVVDEHPETWFAVALSRWVSGDTEIARHWMDRILRHHGDGPMTGPSATQSHQAAQLACIHLMRARLGLEPIRPSVDRALAVIRDADADAHLFADSQTLVPQLLTEVGITQNWLGDLTGAEASLAVAIGLCTSHHLPALAAVATSHLAMTQYMAGHERASIEVATFALRMVGEDTDWKSHDARSRARLALTLAGLVDLPWSAAGDLSTTGPVLAHHGDPSTRFWLQMKDARLALAAGSVAEARRIGTTPRDYPVSSGNLPVHLRVALLVEQAFLAFLATDRLALGPVERELTSIGATGEAHLVVGLRADLLGDRRTAVTQFEAAADADTCPQPDCHSLALTCLAQLLDSVGQPDEALARLGEAVTATEVRRNAVAFLGWSRHGTPMATLLNRLAAQSPPTHTWVHQLANGAAGKPDVTAVYSVTTATARERAMASRPSVLPSLSAREREVLGGLARGATYADIAADLYVSENTVKTHVSSLYAKLAVSRRSDALAVARSMQLM